MKFHKITETAPIPHTYYLVKCPNYCESGYYIASYDKMNKEWVTDYEDNSIDVFVTEFCKLPNE